MRFLLTCTLTLLLFPCSLHAQVAEICTNGIDDDGDTLIDCEDPDCIFSLTGAPPFPNCGIDPTADALECESYNTCLFTSVNGE